MLYKVIDKNAYQDFIRSLIADYQFIGPKKKDDSVHDFVPIKDISELDTGYKRTTLPPAKKLLFPSNEGLVKYEVGEKIVAEAIIEAEEKILFGINAWDINGMNFLDRVFRTDFVDDNYMSKRERLIVIGIDSEPLESNFSLSMGTEYANEGFDLFISELKDKFFVRVATAKGSGLLEKYTEAKDAEDADFKEYDQYLDDYRKKFSTDVSIKSFYDDFENIYDKDEFWNKVAKNCYSCGSCNLACPTCFCFNVKDDMDLNLKTGTKIREWDSCMIPDYGLVAGDHNFRPNKENRLKQRYRCKLKTFKEKFGTYSCVGCGRCIEVCLAKINIADDIESVKKEVSI